MQRYSDNMSQKDFDAFVQTLEIQQFTHKDVMRCYSIFMKNEYAHSKTGKLSPSVKPTPTKRSKKWTEEEIEALRDGVERFGIGNWTKILENNQELFSINNRTAQNLQKKWNNLQSS